MGAKIVPDVTPLVLNAVPVTVTPEIVTFEFPTFVSVVFSELVLPTFTFPKIKFAGFAPRRKVAAVAVPLREMARGEPGALVTSETEPETLPEELGANIALNVVVLPGAIVSGTTRPVMLKPVPETTA